MNRQLYYLLPDVAHTVEVCKELKDIHVPDSSLHVVMNKKMDIDGVKDVHTINEKDRDFEIESHLWEFNLIVFCLSLIALTAMTAWQLSYYILIPIFTLLTTLGMGFYFAMRMPNVHWNEFVNAVDHGDILLIVDVPKRAIQYVDKLIRRRHPEVVTGGVCWKV